MDGWMILRVTLMNFLECPFVIVCLYWCHSFSVEPDRWHVTPTVPLVVMTAGLASVCQPWSVVVTVLFALLRFQRPWGHELRHQNDALLPLHRRFPEVVKSHDVGMLKSLQHLRFLFEALPLCFGQFTFLGITEEPESWLKSTNPVKRNSNSVSGRWLMKEGEWNKCCCCFYISPTEFGTWGRKRLVFHWIELVSSMVKDWCVCDVFRLNTHLVFWVGWTWGSEAFALYSALCIKQTALKCLRPVSTITAVIYHRTGQRTHHLTKRKISTATDEHEINRSFPQTPKHRYF